MTKTLFFYLNNISLNNAEFAGLVMSISFHLTIRQFEDFFQFEPWKRQQGNPLLQQYWVNAEPAELLAQGHHHLKSWFKDAMIK